MWRADRPFVERAAALPRLGLGLSTEYGAALHGVDPVAFREAHPGLVDFLELGVDLLRGLDDEGRAWVARGWPTTWHFLDVNLEEPGDADDVWLEDTRSGARLANAAWICGDAGLWHVGPRDRGHGTLLPPVGCATSVRALADEVRRIRERTGLEVLPENPPAHVLLGDLHPLELFGAVAERADCGLLLDLAHLVIVQQALRLKPTSLLDAFPLERVVELHVAGGTLFRIGEHELVHDDHGPHVQAATWELLEEVLPRCTALRAVVVECERNEPETVVALFERTRALVGDAGKGPPRPPPPVAVPEGPEVDTRTLQRTLFRMLLDPGFSEQVRAGADVGLTEPAAGWLRRLDPDLLQADPMDQRRDQLLGNVATELLHTVRAAPPFLDDFPSSPEFHRAIGQDEPLVLALVAFARRVLPEGPWLALLDLDEALALARRVDDETERAPGKVCRSPRARLIEVPAGTLAAAEALHEDRDPDAIGPGSEHLLIVATPDGPHRPRQVAVERLPDAIAELVAACPLGEAELAAFARRHEASREEVTSLVADLVRDGVLVVV